MVASMLPEGVRERRALEVAPLYRYLRAHGQTDAWLARKLGERYGRPFSRQRLSHIWSGARPAPATFVEDVCQIVGRSREEVFDAANAAAA